MSDSFAAPQVSNSFEDHMEILTQELELAIRWQRPAVVLIAYESAYVRDDSFSILENFLVDHDQKIVRVSVENSAVNSLGFWQKIFEDTDDVVFFLDGFSELNFQHSFLDILNYHAYMFAEKNARLVLWLTLKETSTIAYHAPAFWARRQRLIELTASPKPEQILQSALESAWQGTGEYSEQFEDMEAKISLQETFLTDLPLNNETTSIRANLLLTLGILHWRKGNYEKANEVLHNALMIAAKIQDNWFEAKCYNAIALVKTSLRKHEEAIDSYKQAIKLAPEQIFAWNNLGNLCLQIGRNHEAMIAFEKAIAHNSSDPIAWNGMGNVYARCEYVDDAIAAYRKSIEFAPSLPNPWNGLGEIYAHSGRSTEAVLAFQEAIKLNGRFTLPWLGLARLHARQEHYHEAAKAYHQALMIDPRNANVWNDLGCIYIEHKKYDDAVEALAKAVDLERSFGWAYSNLGFAYACNKKFEESITIYLKSLSLLRDDQQRSLTWNRLANSYRMME
ncbi:MAG TPA: tetratricopeptide repeat protein, partial [Anaerolineales bacterium]|nr:tetratricopeptide repeat protein [Anaerolineales bacterium]